MADDESGNNNGCIWTIILVVGFFTLIGNLSDSNKSGKPDDTTIKVLCRQKLQERLRDPDSLQIISEKLVRPGKLGGEVGYECKYRAKNGFGGLTVDSFYTE
jgi:hypothetical protein